MAIRAIFFSVLFITSYSSCFCFAVMTPLILLLLGSQCVWYDSNWTKQKKTAVITFEMELTLIKYPSWVDGKVMPEKWALSKDELRLVTIDLKPHTAVSLHWTINILGRVFFPLFAVDQMTLINIFSTVVSYSCDHGQATESQRGCKNRQNKIEWPYWCRAECVKSRTNVFSGSPGVSTLYHMRWTFSSTLYAMLEHLQVQMPIVSFVLQKRIYSVFKRHRSIQSQSQNSMCTCIVLQQTSFLEIAKSSYLLFSFFRFHTFSHRKFMSHAINVLWENRYCHIFADRIRKKYLLSLL